MDTFVIVVGVDGDAPFEAEVGAFLADNADDPSIAEAVATLTGPGQSVLVGGGATPVVTLTRKD